MSQHMIISPDPRFDGKWVDYGRTMHWMPPIEPVTWTAIVDPIEPTIPMPEMATLRRYRHPGWKITLAFYVDNRMGADPDLTGRVLPGWIAGQALEQCPLGAWTHDPYEHRWELRTDAGHLLHAVTCEFLARVGRWSFIHDWMHDRDIQPLPTAAHHGCPPPRRWNEPEWQPHTPAEILEILDQANKRDES